MKNIKFGLKLWSTDYSLIEEAGGLIKENLFHYIELLVIPDSEILPFQKVNVPYVIHITHEGSGLNLADSRKEEFNFKVINESIEWADKLNAKYLILHPGFGEIKRTKDFLININDKRILIENMPKVGNDNEKMIGFTPEEIKELKKDKFGFCFDLNHTIKTAVSLKKDYKKYIKEFLKLEPSMFHVSDGNLNQKKDEHLDIGKGEYDFEFLINCIKENESKYLTLETPKDDLSSYKQDLENLKKLKSFL